MVDEAEELCQDIACELYASLRKADAIYNMDGYVWRICRYVYARYVSSIKKRAGVSIDGMDLPFDEDYGRTEHSEEIAELRTKIAFLTKMRRNIVYSFYYEGKSLEKIAFEQGVAVGTVKWHLNKARNELRKEQNMERTIGKLGLSPIKADGFGHCGKPGSNGDVKFYLNDNLNLNIVYSVYFEPKNISEIAAELGVTPVYIESRVKMLEDNGFLVRQAKEKYTTFVCFSPQTGSIELEEKIYIKLLEAAKTLAKGYAKDIISYADTISDVYIPNGNRDLFSALLVFYSIFNAEYCANGTDLSKYYIKTTDGGDYIAYVNLPSVPSDPDYQPAIDLEPYRNLWSCGNMTRITSKYPQIASCSIDTKFTSRTGGWQNNLTSDYEYLYEYITGAIEDNYANKEKFDRLRSRGFINKDSKVNIMVTTQDIFKLLWELPEMSDEQKRIYADYSLEVAQARAKSYPERMQDLVIFNNSNIIGGSKLAIMVLDELYACGVLKQPTEEERATHTLIMKSDVLPK